MPKVHICAAKGVVSQRFATQLTLHFSNRKKRMREIQKKIKTGKINVREDDPLEMFVSSTDIRYCYYNETHKILGNTYGMCILQVCAQLCLLLEKHFCNVHLKIKQRLCDVWLLARLCVRHSSHNSNKLQKQPKQGIGQVFHANVVILHEIIL